MPWREVSKMDQRREFVALALAEGANRRALCRGFGIHPEDGLQMAEALGCRGGPGGSFAPAAAQPARGRMRRLEARMLAVRDAHPAWGARKIARCLEREGVASPAVSTVHEILRRHGRIVPRRGGPPAGLALREAGAEPAVADGLQGLDRGSATGGAAIR